MTQEKIENRESGRKDEGQISILDFTLSKEK